MIGREHDPVDAHFEHECKKRRHEVKTAERVMDILAQIRADRFLQSGYGGLHVVETLDHERKRLAEMTQHELQFRKSIEHAT